MKIIEAMKRVKSNKEKIADLQNKISLHCAHLSHETPMYKDTESQVKSWLQTCEDVVQENIKLLCAIQNTNLKTKVSIEINGQSVTKTISEWVWRRREYAAIDMATFSKLNDRGLKEGNFQTSTGGIMEVKLIRNFDQIKRDEKIAVYRQEPHQIDSTLEVINATTDLIE